MKSLKAKIFAAVLFCTAGVLGEAKANMFCFDNVKIGADYLYWDTCCSGLDYAVEAEDDESIDTATKLKTKHISTDYHSGIRGYVCVDKLWCDFNAGLAYTYYSNHHKNSVSNDVADSVILSTGTPNYDMSGNTASGKWKIEYEALDLLISYPLNISCNSCFEMEAFSGLKFINIKQKRHDRLVDNFDEGTDTLNFKRCLSVSGVGPMLGINSTYTFFDCIKMFGMVGGSVIIADNKSHDKVSVSGPEFSEDPSPRTFKSHDDCACFPGLHLMSGITYETCFCNMEIGLRLGWEYVQWINAPDFPSYEGVGRGTRAAVNEKNLTMQGLFAGINVAF